MSLSTLLYQLYPKYEDIDKLVIQVETLIKKGRQQRSNTLKQWDRILTKTWHTQADHVFYVLYVDLFSPEVKPGQYLQALIQQLDYFVELGVTTIHLLPMYQSSGDAGFAVDDYRTVDKRYGTVPDLRRFIQLAHHRGIKIALDFVLNHTSDNHRWARLAKQGSRYYQQFYIIDTTHTGKSWPNVRDIFYEFAPGHWDYVPEIDEYVWATFYLRRVKPNEPARYPFAQWDLNYHNPQVLQAMISNLIFLANLGVDLFRFDAIAYIWKKFNTSCLNLPENHVICKILRYVLKKIAPHSVILGEAHIALLNINEYFENDNELQLLYNFTLEGALWYTLYKQNTTVLIKTIKKIPLSQKNCSLIILDECHDDLPLDKFEGLFNKDKMHVVAKNLMRYYTRYKRGLPYYSKSGVNQTNYGVCGTRWSMLDGDIRQVLLMDRMKFTLGGIPLIYMGQELGVSNDYSYQADSLKSKDHRFVKRVALVKTQKNNRLLPNTKEQRIFQHLHYLAKLRQQYPALAQIKTQCIKQKNKHVLVYYKRQRTQTIVVVHNISGVKQSIKLPKPYLRTKCIQDIFSQTTIAHHHNLLTLPPYASIGYVLK